MAGFTSVLSAFSVVNLNYNHADSRDVTFEKLDGEVVSSLCLQNGKPQTMNVFSSVESGILTLQIQQDEKIVQIPLGGQVVALDRFDDGTVLIKAIGDGAVNGKVKCTV